MFLWVAASPRIGGTLSSLDVAGRLLPVVPAGGSSPVGTVNHTDPDGPVVAGGPIGPCGASSPLFDEVLDHADPAGQHAVIQEVLEPLEQIIKFSDFIHIIIYVLVLRCARLPDSTVSCSPF